MMNTQKSLAAALLLIASLAAAGSLHAADYDAAVDAANKRDYLSAAQEFQRLAEDGDPRGENGLGVLYANGLGVRKDAKLAADWFTKAAEKGYKAAQNNLGELYLSGAGVEKDYAAAGMWFRKAAAQGDSLAADDVIMEFE